MASTRTVQTLGALFATMVIGAVILMVMETAPVRPPVGNLAAEEKPQEGLAAVVAQTDVPLQAIQWRNVVVHSTGGGEPSDVAERCHFVIEQTGGDVRVRATDLWKGQRQGRHVVQLPWREFNSDSIGICLVGDFAYRQPSRQQFQALVELAQAVQRACAIPADHVYLHSDLDHRTGSPGAAFPGEAFSGSLLRPTR